MGGGIAVARFGNDVDVVIDVGGQSDFRDIECREKDLLSDGREFPQDSTLDMLNLTRLIRICSTTLENPNLIGNNK